MNPTLNHTCPCPGCKARRAQQLRDDLNAMADRRVLTSITREDLIFQDEWHPNWKTIAWSAVGCILFFAVVYLFSHEIGRQAGLWP